MLPTEALAPGGDEPVGVADGGVLGGFNWSSQHLDQEVRYGTTS